MKYFISIKAECDFEIEAENRQEAEKIVEQLKAEKGFINKFTIKDNPLIVAYCTPEQWQEAFNRFLEKYPRFDERLKEAGKAVKIPDYMSDFEKLIGKEEMEAYMNFVTEYGFGGWGFGFNGSDN